MKRLREANLVKKKKQQKTRHLYAAYKRLTSDIRTQRLKVKG